MKVEKWQIVIGMGLLLMAITSVISIVCKYYFHVDAVFCIPIALGGGGLCFFGLILSL